MKKEYPNRPKLEKKKKSLSKDLYTKTQPLRDFVKVALDENPSPKELAHIQSELRRLSRLVKSHRTTAF